METHNGQHVINPSVPNSHCNETEDQGRNWDTQGEHDGPDAHIPRPLFFEECLRHDTGTDRRRRGNKEGRDGTAEAHGRVRGRVGTANITDQAADQGDDEDGPSTVALREGAPEKRGATEEGDDQGEEVTSRLDFDVQVFGDVDECHQDRRGGEGSHHAVEGDKEQVRDFLFAVNCFWFCSYQPHMSAIDHRRL